MAGGGARSYGPTRCSLPAPSTRNMRYGCSGLAPSTSSRRLSRRSLQLGGRAARGALASPTKRCCGGSTNCANRSSRARGARTSEADARAWELRRRICRSAGRPSGRRCRLKILCAGTRNPRRRARCGTHRPCRRRRRGRRPAVLIRCTVVTPEHAPLPRLRRHLELEPRECRWRSCPEHCRRLCRPPRCRPCAPSSGRRSGGRPSCRRAASVAIGSRNAHASLPSAPALHS